mmetsp:Transcript_26328/g.84285  ORF Transcript_26328/g.84285 Transcript_26328/m.84285 type:complete len:216 (+) Transcript_26328:220-867(+)
MKRAPSSDPSLRKQAAFTQHQRSAQGGTEISPRRGGLRGTDELVRHPSWSSGVRCWVWVWKLLSVPPRPPPRPLSEVQSPTLGLAPEPSRREKAPRLTFPLPRIDRPCSDPGRPEEQAAHAARPSASKTRCPACWPSSRWTCRTRSRIASSPSSMGSTTASPLSGYQWSRLATCSATTWATRTSGSSRMPSTARSSTTLPICRTSRSRWRATSTT